MYNLNKKQLFHVNFILMFVLMLFLQNNILYANNWEYANGEWYYTNGKGEAFADYIVEDSGKRYFLSDDGKIARNSFFDFGDNYYYAKADGTLARNEFVFIDFDIASQVGVMEGLYYFGDSSKCFRRTGSNFKRVIDGKTYVVDENGLILTGWIDGDGSKIDSLEDVLREGVYYADENGILYIDKWFDLNNDEAIHYVGDDVETILGSAEYRELDHLWMYFDEHGKKTIANTLDEERVKKIRDIEYSFDENGVMITNFTKTGGIDTTQKSNPTSKKSAKMYLEDDGSLAKNTWFWLAPSEELDAKEHNDLEMHWWRTDKSGKLMRNTIKEIDGKKYVFDGIGRMKAGFVLFETGKQYVANYMPEDLTSDDFIYPVTEGSNLQGQELSDIRYFGNDDKLDGSMKTGNVEIELDDGVFTFGFGSGGIAYGSRRQLKKIKNSYYINGLRLSAKNDNQYGLVKDNGYYKLVDKKGKLKDGNKKAIKADEDYILLMGNRVVGYKKASDMPSSSVEIRWRGVRGSEPAGFYYYDKDAESGVDKYHYGICLNPVVVTTISASDLSNMPDDMKINFR